MTRSLKPRCWRWIDFLLYVPERLSLKLTCHSVASTKLRLVHDATVRTTQQESRSTSGVSFVLHTFSFDSPSLCHLAARLLRSARTGLRSSSRESGMNSH